MSSPDSGLPIGHPAPRRPRDETTEASNSTPSDSPMVAKAASPEAVSPQLPLHSVIQVRESWRKPPRIWPPPIWTEVVMGLCLTAIASLSLLRLNGWRLMLTLVFLAGSGLLLVQPVLTGSLMAIRQRRLAAKKP